MCIFAVLNTDAMVYYRFLFKHMDMLSINEKLVYSSLIAYSIRNTWYYYEDGALDSEYLNAELVRTANENGFGHIVLKMPSTLGLAKETGMSWNTIKKILERFKQIRLIEESLIVCHKELFDQGYITLPNDLCVKGQLLLFYCILEERSRYFNGTIDTWASKLGEILGISKGAIQDMLYKLHKKGLVHRQPDGKLKVEPIDMKKKETSQPPSLDVKPDIDILSLSDAKVPIIPDMCKDFKENLS
jgi:DNA-binding MarR family transcriptional regulator